MSEAVLHSGRVRVTRSHVADNDLALSFLAEVADENKGRTRVGAAIRAINFLRKMTALPLLSDDPRTTMLKEGVLRALHHAPSGALPFPGVLLLAIVEAWEFSPHWWERMTALLLMITFSSLLRGGGILTVPVNTVTWVRGLEESMTPPSPRSDYTGALLLVPARRTSQTKPS